MREAVMILTLDPTKRRIELALAPDNAADGDQVESMLAIGAVLIGTVERVEPFGAFVRVGPGQTGLAHVSLIEQAHNV
ncbi:MAG: S1 RNA-binding domain-containing protein [Candidatus Rokuibacteriota bacterium]